MESGIEAAIYQQQQQQQHQEEQERQDVEEAAMALVALREQDYCEARVRGEEAAGLVAAQSSDEELEELGEKLVEELEEEFGEGLEEELGDELEEEPEQELDEDSDAEYSDVDIEVQPPRRIIGVSEQYEAILRESGRVEADHWLKWRQDLNY